MRALPEGNSAALWLEVMTAHTAHAPLVGAHPARSISWTPGDEITLVSSPCMFLPTTPRQLFSTSEGEETGAAVMTERGILAEKVPESETRLAVALAEAEATVVAVIAGSQAATEMRAVEGGGAVTEAVDGQAAVVETKAAIIVAPRGAGWGSWLS